MPAKDQAAYMREYRRRTKAAQTSTEKAYVEVDFGAMARAQTRIAELEAEVARLKRELAARPERTVVFEGNQGRPFVSYNPVPKPGK